MRKPAARLGDSTMHGSPLPTPSTGSASALKTLEMMGDGLF